MIGPKVEKQTAAEEKRAYEIATRRDRAVCQRCRRVGRVAQRDHRRNRSQGGLTTAANLQLLCVECHAWKGANPREAVAEGWAVPGWADPLVWPARRWVDAGLGILKRVWVLYDDRGGWAQITDEEAARRMTT
jgi:hypothetical protein